MRTATAPPAPLRSDARRNRARLVASARDLFAAAGVDVSVEEITRHAAVGMGTLYRHFPTKEELIDAVLEEAFDEFVGLARAALAEPDAWTGLCRFFEGALALCAQNRGLKDVVATREHGCGRAAAMRRKLVPLLARLVARGHREGALRLDFSPQDIALVLWSGESVIERSADLSPELWRRHLGLLLDGLRPAAATPLPSPPLTRAQLERSRREPGRRRAQAAAGAPPRARSAA